MSEQSPDQASSVDSATVSNPSAHLTHIGPSLIGGREALGLSVDDVSNRLRLSPRQIHALESDDFIILPEAVITRGFIRNYARLLGIDPAPLLQIYNQYVPVQDNQAIAIPSANIVISGEANRSWRTYAWVAGVVILLLGGWIAYMDYFSKKLPGDTVASGNATLLDVAPVSSSASAVAESQSADSTLAEQAPAQLPEAQLPVASIAPATTAQLTEPAVPVVAEPLPASPAPTTPVAVPASPATTSTPVAATTSPSPAAGAAAGQLKFTATEATWISIYDASGKQIANKTLSANSSDTVAGTPPFRIVVGNIKGTTLEYNNKPVDLALYSKVNVARLTLE